LAQHCTVSLQTVVVGHSIAQYAAVVRHGIAEQVTVFGHSIANKQLLLDTEFYNK